MKHLLLFCAILTLMLGTAAGAAAQATCIDGAPDYADTMIEVGETLSESADGSFTDMLQAADGGFETMATIDPPTAFEATHSYLLSALHNLAMAGLAYALDAPTVAETYADAAAQRLEQFNAASAEALAFCGG